MDCFAYNCGSLSEHELVVCNAFPKGGIPAVGILNCDNDVTDPSLAAELDQAITDNELHVVKRIKASIPEAEEVEGENVVGIGADNILDGFNRTILWRDFNVTSDNDAFYASLNGMTTEALIYEASTGNVLWIQNPITWMAKPKLVPENSKEKQHYIVVGKWTDDPDDYAGTYTAPAGIFTVN